MSKPAQPSQLTARLNSNSIASIGRATGWQSLPEVAERRRRQNRMARRRERIVSENTTQCTHDIIAPSVNVDISPAETHEKVETQSYSQASQACKTARQLPTNPHSVVVTDQYQHSLISPPFEASPQAPDDVIVCSDTTGTETEVSNLAETTSTPASMLLPSVPPDTPGWLNTAFGGEVFMFDQDAAVFEEDGSENLASTHIGMSEQINSQVSAKGSRNRVVLPNITRLPRKSSVGSSEVRLGGQTALHKGVMHSHEGIVRLLLANSANTELCNREGKRALHLAAEQGHLGILAALLDAGADVEAQDVAGQRPLHIAAMRGLSAAAELMISKGAKVDAYDGSDVIDVSTEGPEDMEG